MDLDLIDILDAAAPEVFEDGKNLTKVIRKFGVIRGSEPSFAGLRASQIHDACSRAIVYSKILPALPERVSFDAKSHVRMATGTFLHHFYQNQVLGPSGALRGLWVHSETLHVHKGYYPSGAKVGEYDYKELEIEVADGKIPGHVDGLICLNRLALAANGDPITDDVEEDLVHLEIKSSDDNTIRKMKSEGVEELPMRYRTQASIYQKGLGLKRTLFLYVDRKFFEYATFIYEGESTLIEDSLEKVASVDIAMKDKKLPDRHFGCLDESLAKAKACSYREFCFAENAEDVWDL